MLLEKLLYDRKEEVTLKQDNSRPAPPKKHIIANLSRFKFINSHLQFIDLPEDQELSDPDTLDQAR